MSDAPPEAPVQPGTVDDSAPHAHLFAVAYDQLRRIAQRALNRDGAYLTISPTTLLHEAYLDISNRGSAVFPDRVQFMAYAARAMRGVIIDYARSRRALKRGDGIHITSLSTEAAELATDESELQRIADAVDALACIDSRLAQVVDLKFFCGYSFAEIAVMHGVSERTIQRDWEKARLFLHHSMTQR